MVKSKELCSGIKSRIVAKHEAGNSYGRISSELNVPKSTVQSIIKKYKDSNSTANLPRSGRPRKITTRMARKIVRKVQNDPKITRKKIQDQLANEGDSVSLSTVSNTLHNASLFGRRPRRTPLLKKNHREARLKYAKEHVDKDDSFWSQVLWSDETKIEFDKIDVRFTFNERFCIFFDGTILL